MVRSTPQRGRGLRLRQRLPGGEHGQHRQLSAVDAERRERARTGLGEAEVGVLEQVAEAVVEGARGGVIGRDPRSITRSVQYIVDYTDPAGDRATLTRLVEAGFTHLVLSLRSPYPPGIGRRLVNEIVTPLREAYAGTGCS